MIDLLGSQRGVFVSGILALVVIAETSPFPVRAHMVRRRADVTGKIEKMHGRRGFLPRR